MVKEEIIIMKTEDIPLSGRDTSEENPYGFFIFFFDEIKGHIPLFTYPPELIEEKYDLQILAIHPIWWHQEKFLKPDKFNTIELELEGVIYSATLFLIQTERAKKRFGMDSRKWQDERIVLIVRAPSGVSFIAQELILELKDRIQGEIGDSLSILIDAFITKPQDPETEQWMKKKKKSVNEKLSTLCESLIPKIPLSKLEQQLETKILSVNSSPPAFQSGISEESKKLRKLRFSIPVEEKGGVSKVDEGQLLRIEPKHVKLESVIRENNTTRITIKNLSSSTLKDVILKVYQSQSFFGSDTLMKRINDWDPNENVTIEFESENDNLTTYFLRIEDQDGLIKIKRILG